MLRIGEGFDVHKFALNRELYLGGVKIDYRKTEKGKAVNIGLEGHSDADVLLHAICDALLGALALGDIGKHFPDTSDEFLNIDSKILLKRTYELIKKEKFLINNLDCTVIAEAPKLSEHILKMRAAVSEILETDIKNVSIKATTTERLGFTGRKEGIAAKAVVLLKSND